MTARHGALADVETRRPIDTARLDDLTGALFVPPGARALLTTETGRSAVEPRLLATSSAEEFRAWLNLPEREVLERWYSDRGRFQAAVYALGEVTIGEDASLVVRGAPAILLFRHLTIHAAGRLFVHTVCHGRFGQLEKRAGRGLE